MPGRMTICNMTIEGGGRAGHDRPRRDHLRVGPRPPRRAGGLRRRRRALARAADRRRRELRHGGRGRRRARSRRWSPGAPTPAWSSRSPTPSPTRRRWTRRSTAKRPSAPSPTWAWSAGTPMTEVAPGTGLHRLLHQLADRGPARGRRGGRRPQGRRHRSGRWSCPAPSRSKRPPKPRAWTRSSAAPASNGARRAARCAWG